MKLGNAQRKIDEGTVVVQSASREGNGAHPNLNCQLGATLSLFHSHRHRVLVSRCQFYRFPIN